MMYRTRFGQVVIAFAGLLLIGVAWIGTLDAIRAERLQATAHASADVANQALVFEQEVRRQFLVLDQTIAILEREWERDPARFDLNAWRARTAVLADLANVPGKLQDSLRAAADRVTMNEQLARLRTDVVLAEPLAAPVTTEALAAVRTVFEELEFQSLVGRVDALISRT